MSNDVKEALKLEARAGEWADAQRVFLTAEAERDAALARVKELEGELEQAKASETVAWSDCEPTRPGPYGTVYVHDGCGACARCVDAARAERDAALARVKELEAQLGGMTEQWKAELNHANAWMRKYQASEAERDALKTQLAEAAGVLRRIAGPQGMGFGGMDGARLAECARAFLAKYPEGR